MVKIGRNDLCSCGSGIKYKKCCLDRPRLELVAPDLVDPRGEWMADVELIVDTPSGRAIRSVPAAMPLRLGLKQGLAAEVATYSAAATWGLPDFVFGPALRQVGAGVREMGDGALIVGDAAILVQVKSREATSSDSAKEHRWLSKHTRRALRQGKGSIRQLKLKPAAMTNGRGREILIDGRQYRWIVAVVLDHDNPPDTCVPATDDEIDGAVVLLRRDWEFLFDQLKSTHSVASYLERVAGEPIELGAEPIRYYELASADATAQPAGLDPRFALPVTTIHSEPLLPLAPAASEDARSHAIVRMLLDDIAIGVADNATETQRLDALSEIDRLQVGKRAMVGSYLREQFAVLSQPYGDQVAWRFRRFLGGPGSTQLGFGVCSRFDETIHYALKSWVMLRHHEFQSKFENEADEPITIGVLITPRRDGVRDWDTTMSMITGHTELDAEELAACVELWKSEEEASRPAA